MAKIPRALQKLFGSTAGPTEVGKFGSLAAGLPETTTDPVLIQSLSQFLDGWNSAILGSNSPAIEDMNALFFLGFRQIAYLFQQGVSEWNVDTSYYIGSIVLGPDNLVYQSITDDNLGNAVTVGAEWKLFSNNPPPLVKNADYTITMADKIILATCVDEAGDVTLALPSAVGVDGKEIIIKRTDNLIQHALIINPNGAETIDGLATKSLYTNGETIRIISFGGGWVIIGHDIPSLFDSYTPVGAWSTNTSYTGSWKRDAGGTMSIDGRIDLSGAPSPVGTLTYSLPTGAVIDTSRVPSVDANISPWNSVVAIRNDGTATHSGIARYAGGGDVTMSIAYLTSSALYSNVTPTSPFVFANNDFVSVKVSGIPIVGWE